ncbi:IspD/TarI family cytidylyltransferase [Thermotoga profunda]|uniref:IspD/TarI family cytidylyltransferase n=1 Tax=Thermotoga profunda TaxID=1508420 RepID=UPI000597361C|nr:IspD/TarI family cytidylyltransferase [Thermotoga profunda]
MTIGIIMAAGKGIRAKTDLPKQFCKICDKPVLSYSLSTFEKSTLVDSCLVMIPDGWKDNILQITREFSKVRWILTGGMTRHETSLIAIDFLKTINPSIVIFHDAARPFLSLNLLEKVIQEAKIYGAATAAISVSDTVAYCKDDFVDSYIPRESLYRIQTPQAFEYRIIADAIRKFQAEDGTKPVFLSNRKIRIVEGDPYCFKITKPEDLDLAGSICKFWKNTKYSQEQP